MNNNRDKKSLKPSELVACIAGFFLCFVIFLLTGNVCLGSFVFLVVVIFVIVAPLHVEKKKENKKQHERRVEMEESNWRWQCKNLVKRAEEMNIGVNESNFQEKRNDLQIINDNYNCIDSQKDVVEAYRLGLLFLEEDKKKEIELKKQEETAAEQAKKQEYIKNLQGIYDNQVYVSGLVGKKKYLDLVYKRLDEICERKKRLNRAKSAAIELGGILGASGPALPNDKSPELDLKTSALAGAATAIGGPLAGMMVISDSMSQQMQNNSNVDREVAYKQHSKWISDILTPVMISTDKQLNTVDTDKLSRKIRTFDVLIDSRNMEEKSENIKASVENSKVISEYEICVDIKFSVEEVEIFDKPAVIDGSFCVDVYDQRKKVAFGILSGRGYGITDMRQIGFKDNSMYRIVCFSPNGNINKEADLRIEVKPKHLWYIRRK